MAFITEQQLKNYWKTIAENNKTKNDELESQMRFYEPTLKGFDISVDVIQEYSADVFKENSQYLRETLSRVMYEYSTSFSIYLNDQPFYKCIAPNRPMSEFDKLHQALNEFRNLFVKKIVDVKQIQSHQSFLQSIGRKFAHEYTVSEAFKIYSIIKPFADKLKLVGYDFSQVSVPKFTAPAPIERTASQQSKIIGYNGSVFVVRFPYSVPIFSEIKNLPSAVYEKEESCWKIGISATKELREFAKKHNFEIGDKALAMMNNAGENLEKSYSSEYIELGLPLKKNLFAFQTVGVDYGMRNKRVIVADDMGLGKTVQGIGIILGTEAFPALVLCPKTLRLNWKDEWEMWTNKRVMILDHKNKHQLKNLLETNMIDVVITNYDGAETFFVEEIKTINITQGERAGTSYEKIITNELEQLFKGVIADEAHHCFTYDTEILTEVGWKKIGTIVENKEQLNVYSHNGKEIELKPIINWFKNDLSEKKLLRITLKNGREIICTTDHKIATPQGYKRANLLCGTDNVYYVSDGILDAQKIATNPILLQEMPVGIYENKRSVENEIITGATNHSERKARTSSLQNVWQQISGFKEKATKILFGFLCFKKFSRNETQKWNVENDFRKQREIKKCSNETNEPTGSKSILLSKNENQKSNEQSRNGRKNESKNERQNIFGAWWKWRTNTPTISNAQRHRLDNGICDTNKIGKTFISKFARLLQSGFGNTGKENCNRNRRQNTQNKEVAIFGQTKNRSVELVRVESVEILERGSGREHSALYKHGFVYDITVEDNHNYFAGGILVHNCRNANTRRFKVVKKCFDGKDVRVVLTGTPVVKGAKDLAALLDLVGRIEEFGGRYKFVRAFGEMDKSFFHAMQKPENELTPQERRLVHNYRELNIKLRSTCFIRREKLQVLKDLPDKFRKIVRVPLDNKKDYDHAFFSLQDWLAKNGASAGKIDMALRAQMLVQIGILKQLAAKGKFNAVKEFAEEVAESGEKLIIFCWYNETVQWLKTALKQFNPVTISGKIDGRDTKDEEIQEAKRKFQNDPETKVIILTYGKGGEGHTLTSASKVAFIELGWTYKDQGQAEDRSYRIGQKNNVECYYFLGEDTIDEHIYKIIDTRRQLEKETTGGNTDYDTTFTDLTKVLMKK